MEDSLIHIRMLFFFGIALIIFGYWWNATMYWCIKNTPLLDERLEEIKVNKEDFNDLKYNEKNHIRLRDSAPKIKKFCVVLGSIMTLVGFISIVFIRV